MKPWGVPMGCPDSLRAHTGGGAEGVLSSGQSWGRAVVSYQHSGDNQRSVAQRVRDVGPSSLGDLSDVQTIGGVPRTHLKGSEQTGGELLGRQQCSLEMELASFGSKADISSFHPTKVCYRCSAWVTAAPCNGLCGEMLREGSRVGVWSCICSSTAWGGRSEHADCQLWARAELNQREQKI